MLIVHQQENFRARVDQIRTEITTSQVHKSVAIVAQFQHSAQRPYRPLIDFSVQTCTWIDMSSTDKSDENNALSSTNLSLTSTGPYATSTTTLAFLLIVEPVALALSTDDRVCVLLAACSVLILQFSGDSAPQFHEQMVEMVNAIPQKWISERFLDIQVLPTEDQTVTQGI